MEYSATPIVVSSRRSVPEYLEDVESPSKLNKVPLFVNLGKDETIVSEPLKRTIPTYEYGNQVAGHFTPTKPRACCLNREIL
jgi:hypothetical protein